MARRILPLSLVCPLLLSQAASVLSVAPLEKARVQRSSEFTEKLTVDVKPGFHVNSNAPEDEYLIPLKLTWTGPLQSETVTYPKAERIKSAFSEKPVPVFTGKFEIVSKLKVPPNAPTGPNLATAKLRYQACNDRECLPPKTVDVNLSLDIR